MNYVIGYVWQKREKVYLFVHSVTQKDFSCGRMTEKNIKGSGVSAYISQMLLARIQILHFLKEKTYMWNKILSCGTVKIEQLL
jgi:hypothetical protein